MESRRVEAGLEDQPGLSAVGKIVAKARCPGSPQHYVSPKTRSWGTVVGGSVVVNSDYRTTSQVRLRSGGLETRFENLNCRVAVGGESRGRTLLMRYARTVEEEDEYGLYDVKKRKVLVWFSVAAAKSVRMTSKLNPYKTEAFFRNPAELVMMFGSKKVVVKDLRRREAEVEVLRMEKGEFVEKVSIAKDDRNTLYVMYLNTEDRSIVGMMMESPVRLRIAAFDFGTRRILNRGKLDKMYLPSHNISMFVFIFKNTPAMLIVDYTAQMLRLVSLGKLRPGTEMARKRKSDRGGFEILDIQTEAYLDVSKLSKSENINLVCVCENSIQIACEHNYLEFSIHEDPKKNESDSCSLI